MTITGCLEPQLIERLFCHIPSESLLKALKTELQIKLWLTNRQFFCCVALAWLGDQFYADDPLQPLVDQGSIDKDTHRMAWQYVRQYRRMWELIRITYPFLKKECEEFKWELPFRSAYALFSYIVQGEADLSIKIIQKPYIEISSSKNAKGLRQFADHIAGKPMTKLQAKNFENLCPFLKAEEPEPCAVWLYVVWNVACKNANSRNPLLKDALEDWNRETERMYRSFATIAKKGRSSAYSFGQLSGKGQRGGKYSRES